MMVMVTSIKSSCAVATMATPPSMMSSTLIHASTSSMAAGRGSGVVGMTSIRKAFFRASKAIDDSIVGVWKPGENLPV